MSHLHSGGRGDPSFGWCHAHRWGWNTRWADTPGDTRRKWTDPHWSPRPPPLHSGTAQDRGIPGVHKLQQTQGQSWAEENTRREIKHQKEFTSTYNSLSRLMQMMPNGDICKYNAWFICSCSCDYVNAQCWFSICRLVMRKTLVCLLPCRWGICCSHAGSQRGGSHIVN